MSDTIKLFLNKEYTRKVEIVRDYDCNPRTDWDNLGTMVLSAANNESESIICKDLLECIKEYKNELTGIDKANMKFFFNDAIILPIYRYVNPPDYIAFSQGKKPPLKEREEMYFAGVIYVKKQDVLDNFEKSDGVLTKEDISNAFYILKTEVEQYNKYLKGEFMGYIDSKRDKIGDEWVVDFSCYGYEIMSDNPLKDIEDISEQEELIEERI